MTHPTPGTTPTITLAVRDGHITTTSRQIAAHFGKQHSHVLRAIANLDCSEEFRRSNFGSAFYTDEQGKPRQEYILTRDGFVFLCMGFTGRDAAQWKEKYIAAFNAMETELRAGGTAAKALPAKPALDAETISRINRHAWALAQGSFERFRTEMTREVERRTFVGPIEKWQPVERRISSLRQMEAAAICLNTFAKNLRSMGRELADMVDTDYEADVMKYYYPTGKKEAP